ncbi:MAG: Fe-S cluster assembly protein SufD [Bdellovibrionaceae bacterium]|nr:Fe-S cluster assembly protein SufD [Pseudobdellovibrionaceae bacterium]NUM57666.1 Fe-S cluster assembly protein SufD [Pseudobdellovibrionaceae bacterium]
MSILNSFDSLIQSTQAYLKKIGIEESKINQLLDEKKALKEQLLEMGLPKRTNEFWKYTSLKFLNDTPFYSEFISDNVSSDLEKKIEAHKTDDFFSLVFINGFFSPALSDNLPVDQVYIKKNFYSSCFKKDFSRRNGVESSLDTPIKIPMHKSEFYFSDFFLGLGQVYNSEEVVIEIKKGIELSKPLKIILFSYSEQQKAILSSSRISIKLEEQAKASVVVKSVGEDGVKYFSQIQLEVLLNKKSNLELINSIEQSYQAYHIDQFKIDLHADSQCHYLENNIGSLLTRHELEVNLLQPGANAKVMGVAYLQKKEQCDSHTKIKFHASHTQAEQLYKNILDDEAISVFCGNVIIDEHINDVNSAQLNNNLLMSNQCESHSKPVLMIYSDDVKASHGSTVGQLNEEELFYLRSRALSKEKAKELLSSGFLLQVYELIDSQVLRSYLKKSISLKIDKKQARPELKMLKV